MSCFSGPISRAVNTRIFARVSAQATQFLVYQMEYAADNDLAMLLPLPTPPDAAPDAVRFIDLSAYPHFFSDLANGMPKPRGADALGDAPAYKNFKSSVKNFDAAFAPSRAALTKLDAPFRIPDAVWDELPEYHDYGFAVITLRAAANAAPLLALEFKTRNPQLLFFPTVHIQDGHVPANVYFDHDLYCQHHTNWMRSYDNAPSFMNIALTQGIVAPNRRVEWLAVRGMHPNSDIVLEIA
ncbi:MAG: hypothetical protein HDKAJFGB_00806 [Anaerolineae bacterium]|nr:hypothetical protein [Anaerolineae bacterium]